MKLSTRIVVVAVILSVALFVIGTYSWGDIFTALLPRIGNTGYLDTNLTGRFSSSTLFGLTLALIPIVTIVIWRFAPVVNAQRRILTVCIIVLAIIASVQIRREMIKLQARDMQSTIVLDYSDPVQPRPQAITNGIPVSNLKFEVFALAGLLAGAIISFFSVRQKNVRLMITVHSPAEFH